jgi:ElaB/YqjD/DUF883 family membrane-anchored ribosome-binding protein
MKNRLTASHGTIAGWKNEIATDLKVVVADADDLLNEIASSTTEEFATARSKIEATLKEARSRVDDARILIGKRANHAANATQEYVVDNPWKVLGIAAAAGLIAAVLLSRRE